MKLVIFDCDGTLIDSQHAIVAAIGDAFERLSLKAPGRSEVMSIIGLSLPEAFAALAPEQSDDVQHELSRLYKAAFTEHRRRDAHQEPLYPGISEVVATLSAQPDVMLGVATGKSRPGVDRLLAREGWQDAFVSIQTADHHPSKPHPSMIFTALQDCGVAPEQAVMIGDTTFDMEMARHGGVGALGVSWGYHTVAALRKAGAHHVSGKSDTLLADIDRVLDQPA